MNTKFGFKIRSLNGKASKYLNSLNQPFYYKMVTEIPNTLKFVVKSKKKIHTVHPNALLVFEYMCNRVN